MKAIFPYDSIVIDVGIVAGTAIVVTGIMKLKQKSNKAKQLRNKDLV